MSARSAVADIAERARGQGRGGPVSEPGDRRRGAGRDERELAPWTAPARGVRRAVLRRERRERDIEGVAAGGWGVERANRSCGEESRCGASSSKPLHTRGFAGRLPSASRRARVWRTDHGSPGSRWSSAPKKKSERRRRLDPLHVARARIVDRSRRTRRLFSTRAARASNAALGAVSPPRRASRRELHAP